MKYFLIAGEASGDLHAGRLIKALRNCDPQAAFRFLGGDCMAEAAGIRPVVHYREMAFMAFSEVLRHLPQIGRNLNTARKSVLEFAPDAVILIDYPSFNLKIAKFACALGIPVYYYISPKVWAWKEYRVAAIRKYIRKVFSILPFETEFYARRNCVVEYTGNPTVNEIDEARQRISDRQAFLSGTSINSDARIIALLPGSRYGEIRNNLPLMAKAAAHFPEFTPVIAAAPNISRDFYMTTLRDCRPDIVPEILAGKTYQILAGAEAALVTSGTATLEAAIVGTPQVVCYRANGSKLSYKLFEHILKVPYVSLPNLIANRQVVDELLVHLCTEKNITESLRPLLSDTPRRRDMLDGYRTVRERLGNNDSAETTAKLLVDDLNRARHGL